MTSSEASLRHRADAVIDKMARCLDEDYLVSHIDVPIDRAVAEYSEPEVGLFSHQHLHHSLARFVAHLYAHGLPCPRRLSPAQSNNEAVALLEAAYEGACANGYFAAVVDASLAQPDGMEVVRARLAEALKAEWRRMHVRWVFAAALPPSDWELRSEIAAILLRRLRPWLPARMAQSPPARFADDIPALFTLYLDVNRQEQESIAWPTLSLS